MSDSVNATFAPQEQQSVVMIPIMEDELAEDIEYFGIRFRLDPTDVLSVVFRSGEITLAVGVILDASGSDIYVCSYLLTSLLCIICFWKEKYVHTYTYRYIV